MAPVLPLELLQTLNREIPCRESQLRQLATHFTPDLPWRSTLLAYGLEGTAKLKTITTVLEARNVRYALVRCRLCLSQRHLLSKIVSTITKALGRTYDSVQYDKIDGINALVTALEKLMRTVEQRVVLVIDGIDRQRSASSTLLAALARLGDMVPNITTIFVSNSSKPLALLRPGVLYVIFPPYTRDEAISIVLSSPEMPQVPGTELLSSKVDQAALQKFYAQFVATVYDSLIAPTSSISISTFGSTVSRLWPRFIHPYVTGQAPPGLPTSGTVILTQAQVLPRTWDFAKLMIVGRPLFQTEGEQALLDRLVSNSSRQVSPFGYRPTRPLPLLKFFATLILVSAYLASHTPPKFDTVVFSRLAGSSTKNRTKRRKLKLARARPNSALSKTTNLANGASNYRSPGKHAAGAGILDPRSSLARPFTLDRLTAIQRVVHPTGISQTKSTSDRTARELAELERLRLVVSTSAAETRSAADGDDERKWRINVSRDVVDGLAKNWGVSFSDYEIGAGAA